MNRSKYSYTPYRKFEIHQINSTGKIRDSPTSSILKTPTPIFVTTRGSLAKTKRLKFANGPVDLLTLKNGTHESNASLDSGVDLVEYNKLNNNGEINFSDSVEVAISPVKTMQVSPESWKAFLEYSKYNDYANETEKTDYTYSRLSKYRHKEIIPGFLIRPNLSRSSISSRRSSYSLPSSLTSLSESCQSKSYDFNVYNQSYPEISNDTKTFSQHKKYGRSKHFLRSSSLNWKDTSETNSEYQNYLEKENLVHSPSDRFIKAYSESNSNTLETTPRYGTIRSMDFDDADIDEVDIDPAYTEKRNYIFSGSNTDRLLVHGAQSPKISNYFKNFFTTVFLYITSVGTFTSDLFSKYVLRKHDNWYQSPASSYNWKSDSLSKSGMSTSWMPWKEKAGYSTGTYYSGGYYGEPRHWYQRIYHYFFERFSQLSNLIWGNSSRYTSYRYSDTSNKKRFLWFLIPLLLLAGALLFKAEQDNGFLSSQYKELDCRTNGFFTSLENTIKPIWRSSYIAYKKAAASASCYLNDSWERLKLPFNHLQERLGSKFSSLFEGVLTFFNTIWTGFFQALLKSFILIRDIFSNLCLLLTNFLGDFLNAVHNMMYYISKYFADLFFTFFNSLKWIVGSAFSYLYLLLTPAQKSEIKNHYQKSYFSEDVCLKQQNSIDKLTNKLEDFKSITWDLSSLKKKIDDLEAELRKEKEVRISQSELFDKHLDEKHKVFQKYQATVNHALLSSKRPAQPSSASLQYLLDNQSDALKQWISQNFLLKSDSTNIDENKIALLIAKYGNKTGEELLALKRELQVLVKNHKSDLESVRNHFSTFEAHNFGDGDVSLVYIKKLIADAIKLYDADKTGRVDYALETAGGQVLSTRCTETYMERPKSYVFMGWSVYTEASSPREAIRPGMAAGQCWAFVGSRGYLVLKLSHTIRVTGFTMEHISKLLVPKGHIESAPKNFSMWGLKHEHDLEPHLFGEYTYLDNDETIQYFPVTYSTDERYNMVELNITSNHGNPNYTCLYRIRVHGDSVPIHS